MQQFICFPLCAVGGFIKRGGGVVIGGGGSVGKSWPADEKKVAEILN